MENKEFTFKGMTVNGFLMLFVNLFLTILSIALIVLGVNIGESVSLFRGLGLALAKAAFCLMLLGRYKEAEVHLQRMGKIYNIMHTEWEDGLQGGGLAFSIMGVLNCRKKDWYHAGICFNVAKRLVNEAKRPLWQAMLYWAKLELESSSMRLSTA